MIVLPQKLSEAKDSDSVFVIELYEINLSTGTTYIAACDIDITFAGQKYIAIPIEREEIVRSVDNVVDNMNLKIADCDEDKLAYIMNGFDFRDSDVKVIKVLYPECLTDSTQWSPCFEGFIDSPSYSDGVFSCVVKSRFPSVQIPNRSCQMPCNNEFGDEDCCVDKDERTLIVAEGSTKTAIFYGDSNMKSYWKNGVITIGGESRIIRDSTDRIYVNVGFIQDITAGMALTIQRGCDKMQNTCKSRYNNMRNFTGFPSIPFESTYR